MATDTWGLFCQSFHHPADSLCVSELYELLKTGKWMPSVSSLRRNLQKCGFTIIEMAAAPPLKVTADELGERYHLNHEEMREVRRRISHDFGDKPGVFELTEDGFNAYLDYWIFSCQAI